MMMMIIIIVIKNNNNLLLTIKLTIKTYLQLTLQKKKVFGQSTIYNSFHFDYKKFSSILKK